MRIMRLTALIAVGRFGAASIVSGDPSPDGGNAARDGRGTMSARCTEIESSPHENTKDLNEIGANAARPTWP